MANEPLRGCPLCGTPVSEAKLGLRDFNTWLDDLPGRIAPTDIDLVLERKGHFLVLELKPFNMTLPLGQRLMFKQMVRLGMDVWVVWEDKKEGFVRVGSVDKRGNVNFAEVMSVAKLRFRVEEWLEEVAGER